MKIGNQCGNERVFHIFLFYYKITVFLIAKKLWFHHQNSFKIEYISNSSIYAKGVKIRFKCSVIWLNLSIWFLFWALIHCEKLFSILFLKTNSNGFDMSWTANLFICITHCFVRYPLFYIIEISILARPTLHFFRNVGEHPIQFSDIS